MEIKAVLLARVLAFFEMPEINPHGGLFFPDVVKALVGNFSFQKYPRTYEEWTSSEGSIFSVGRHENTVIERLILYNNGLQLETRVSTAESKRLIESLLGWAQQTFHITYPSIREWAYVSDLTFHSDVPILVTGPLERLSKRVTAELQDVLANPAPYVPTVMSVGHDILLRKYPRAPFTIQRRAEAPFSENKYYSEAPLPTDVHIEILQQYEKDVAEMLNPRLLAQRS